MVLYQSQGRTQMAEQVADKLHQHRLKNPYYLASLAERALQAKDYSGAVILLKKLLKSRRKGILSVVGAGLFWFG